MPTPFICGDSYYYGIIFLKLLKPTSEIDNLLKKHFSTKVSHNSDNFFIFRYQNYKFFGMGLAQTTIVCYNQLYPKIYLYYKICNSG